jgi:predicted transcriptional regulator of viral defense system
MSRSFGFIEYTYIRCEITTTIRTERRMEYRDPTGGITAENRRLLQLLHRSGPGPFTADDAAELWRLPANRAGRLLRTLEAGGWLARPRRGLYVPVPLEAARAGEWHEDPWVIATKLFPDGYIGGWSACEHWELTDQVFREVLVYSTRRVAGHRVPLDIGAIEVRKTSSARLFGLRSIWRSTAKLAVSDPSRTLIDILDSPSNGGGIRHVAEVVDAYFRSEHRQDEVLVGYGERFGNRAVFKRLGYLIEVMGIDAPAVASACVSRISRGISALDPGIAVMGPIRTRWNLRINAEIRA